MKRTKPNQAEIEVLEVIRVLSEYQVFNSIIAEVAGITEADLNEFNNR